MYAVFSAAALIALFAAPIAAQTGGIPGVLAPGVESELVQEGFTFTEGPVGTADGGLYFSDIRVSRVFHLDAAGKITVARENTNGTNGIALTREGDLLFAEGEGKRISKRGRDGSVTTVTNSFEGNPFWHRTTLSSTRAVESISRIRVLARWWPVARPMSSTCRRAPKSRSPSTARFRDRTGSHSRATDVR